MLRYAVHVCVSLIPSRRYMTSRASSITSVCLSVIYDPLCSSSLRCLLLPLFLLRISFLFVRSDSSCVCLFSSSVQIVLARWIAQQRARPSSSTTKNDPIVHPSQRIRTSSAVYARLLDYSTDSEGTCPM